MMQLPSIAILSAVWNESAHIEEMIESLLAQTHPRWGVYFVDDGSSDNTAEIIETWAAKDPRIHLVARHEHRGKVAAFNAAFEASEEDLVCLLAGDDTMPPDSLEVRCQALSDVDPHTTYAASWGKLRTFSDNPADDGILMPRGKEPSRSGAAGALTRALADLIFPIPEQLPNEDTWLTICAQELAGIDRPLTKVVANYRLHSGNTSPRRLPFDEFFAMQARRGEVWRLLAEEPRLPFGKSARERIARFQALEEARRRKSLLGIARVPGVPVLHKAADAWKANPVLYKIRWSNYRLFNGWLKA